MKYEIDIRPRATADLDEIQENLSAYSEETANRTYTLIKDGILSLTDFPRRFALAPESARADIEIRHLIIGNYRVLYSIIGPKVRIARVVHAARRAIDPIELF